MNNEYIDKLFNKGFEIEQVNQLSKIDLDLSNISLATPANKIRNLKELLKNKNYYIFINALVNTGADVSNFFDEKFLNIDFNTQSNLIDIYRNKMDTYYLFNEEYDLSQISMIAMALIGKINPVSFAKSDYSANRMYTYINALKNGIDLSPYEDFDDSCLDVICNALLYNKHNKEDIDISIFAKKRYDHEQMGVIFKALKNEVDNIDKILNHKYSAKQMSIIYEGLVSGLNVDLYAKEEFTHEKMEDIFEILCYADNQLEGIADILNNNYNAGQMAFLVFCLEHDIDITEFKDAKYSVNEMLEIAKFIGHFKNNDFITLEQFKELDETTKVFVNKLFQFHKEKALNDIDLNKLDLQTIKKSLFNYNKTYKQTKPYSIKREYYNVDIGEYLLEDGNVLKIEYDEYCFDDLQYSEYLSHIESNEYDLIYSFIEEKENEIEEILDKMTFFLINDHTLECCYFDKEKPGIVSNASISYCSTGDMYNFFSDELFYSYNNEFDELKECVVEDLKDLSLNEKTQYDFLSNLNSFKQYGFRNFDDQYYYTFINGYREEYFLYIDVDQSNEENLDSIFASEAKYYQDIVEGNVFYVELIDGKTGEHIDGCGGINENVYEIAEQMFGVKIKEAFIENEEER